MEEDGADIDEYINMPRNAYDLHFDEDDVDCDSMRDENYHVDHDLPPTAAPTIYLHRQAIGTFRLPISSDLSLTLSILKLELHGEKKLKKLSSAFDVKCI